jgi:hypothetical protein
MTMRGVRWELAPHPRTDEVLCVDVRTARGTGRTALGTAYIGREAVDDRRVLAQCVRDARKSAMRFRQRHA